MTALTEPTARAYDVVAPAYDLLTTGYAYGRGCGRSTGSRASTACAGRRALDVACGTGKSLEALLDLGLRGGRVRRLAGHGRRRPPPSWPGAPGCSSPTCAACPALGGFDLVTCLDDALNHLPTPELVTAALRAMGANLAPGGLLAFDVNTFGAYRDAGDLIVEDGERIVLWHGGPARLDAPGGRAEVAMDVLQPRRRRPVAARQRLVGPLALPARLDPGARAARPGSEVVAVRGQLDRRAYLKPDADEDRHRKAVFLARNPRPERRDHALASVDD